MRIVTVNLPETHLDAIAKLCGTKYDSQYPSRSEFVRRAVSRQLEYEFKMMNDLANIEELETVAKRVMEESGIETKIRKFNKIKIKVPIERQREVKETEEKKSSYLVLRKLYPDLPDYKFIGEA